MIRRWVEMFLFRNFRLFLQWSNKSYAYSAKNNNDPSSLEVLCVCFSFEAVPNRKTLSKYIHFQFSNSFLDLSHCEQENRAPSYEWRNVIVAGSRHRRRRHRCCLLWKFKCGIYFCCLLKGNGRKIKNQKLTTFQLTHLKFKGWRSSLSFRQFISKN